MAGEKILIIDDSALSREFLVEAVLKPGGYAPLALDSLKAGVHVAAEQQPDLIILSMQTPGFDRLDLLGQFVRNGRAIPVILTTEHRSDPSTAEAYRRGARDVLVAPFEPGQVKHSIERVLAEERLRRERDELAAQLAQTRRQMGQQLQELNALYTIGKAATGALDLEQLLTQVVQVAANVTGAEQGLLLLLDESGRELYLRAASNVDEALVRKLRVRVDDSILGRVIKSGRPVSLAGPALQEAASWYPVKALLYVPLIVPPDRIIGVLGVSNQTSERNLAERDVFLLSAMADYVAVAIENARLLSAAESERSKLQAVLNDVEDAVVVLDQDKRVLLCNPAARRYFGIGASPVAGRALSELVRSQALLDLFEHPPAPGQPVRAEVQAGDNRILQAQVSAIEGIGYAAVMQDITHLKELDRIKSDYVSIVSHDLRTPLTTIRGYVELMAHVGPLNERQTEFIARALRSIKMISDLIGDLLDIDYIEAGLEQEATPCRLDDIVRQVVEALYTIVAEKRHALSVNILPDLPPVMGNTRRLEQVVLNLIGNAVKYTPAGGKINVSLQVEGPYLVLDVTDNGIGIPPEDLPYVFEKFYRVQSHATAAIAGTGLGLSIVRSIVEKYGGRVWVESKPGQGSKFVVLLPAQQ